MPLLNRRGFLSLLSGFAVAPSLARPAAGAGVVGTIGLAPIVESIGTAEERHQRVVEFSWLVRDGGPTTVSISEFLPGPTDARPDSLYLNLYQYGSEGPSDQDFGVCVTPRELDALIANLAALRDRARALGFVRRDAGGR